ncbi:hypothetical protein DEV91_111133 [Phyllobacterium brassicacearum]|nr:hypothetical protein DEV91_111133 [Phyllobacterium brassicacearum]
MPLNTFRNEDYSVASKDHALVYPLSVDKRPPETTFVNIFGTQSNKKHVNDLPLRSCFDIDPRVDARPKRHVDPLVVGHLVRVSRGQLLRSYPEDFARDFVPRIVRWDYDGMIALAAFFKDIRVRDFD